MTQHTSSLARSLFNQWRTIHHLSEHLYGAPLDDRKLRAARQALSRLREAVREERWPLEVPAGKVLVLDERWERKEDGNGSEKCYRLRLVDRREGGDGGGLPHANYVQLWFQPSSWMGWVVPGFAALERDRLLSHKHLYAATRGPDNWLTVASNPLYREVDKASGEAMRGEMYAEHARWVGSGDVVYIGLGTGSGLGDARVLRELLEENRTRCVRAVTLDFSPVLLSVAVSNLYQEFENEIRSGRLSVHPILGDIERPDEWTRLLPALGAGASLVVSMLGNTIGHLQYRERQTLLRVLDGLDEWARRQGRPRWSVENMRFLLGVSLMRRDGAPHGKDEQQIQRWLNFVADPLRDLLETAEGEYETVALPSEKQPEENGRRAVAELRPRGRKGRPLGRFWHEELPYKPADGITGVVQRYCFVFEEDVDLQAERVFTRHHLPRGLWQDLEALRARFAAGEDQIVLCEVTQFDLRTFRPALRRMGVVHAENQVYRIKIGNTEPYAVLAFARA